MSDSGHAAADLRTEYLVNPLGIGERRPRLSWVIESGRRGVRQTAYRIVAGSSREHVARGVGDRWDSGWVVSRAPGQIAYEGSPVAARERVWWAVRVRDDAGTESTWSEPAFWETGLIPTDWTSATGSERSEWKASWVSLPGLVPAPEVAKAREWDGLVPAPYFRAVFATGGGIVRANLYVTARGVYEAHLNGEVVGDRTLDPGWTDYNRRIQYQAFDVTNTVRDGENVLGAIVAPGWYAGYVGFGPQCRHYGTTPQLLMQLHLELADGTENVITTGDAWRASIGAIRYGDLLLGEHVDARHHPAGWDAPGFDDRGWQPVAVAGIGAVPIVASVAEPVREQETISPVSVTEYQPGVWIIDLGQNIAGRIHLTARGEAGTEVRLRHGEMLNEDGSLYTENLRGPYAEDTFILAGTAGDETFAPRFTWHGFRYVDHRLS
ncbi:MAG TPA: family 78 glycoside hydrolase catalytic domain [Thermomicrobiales bacterium]|nr:family 78 glycoside hydrolase catalytic domain [Thermomicrobiales bacterium]